MPLFIAVVVGLRRNDVSGPSNILPGSCIFFNERLRACANRSWSSGRSIVPAVAAPGLPDESPDDDDHVRERYPEVDEPPLALRAPRELLVGVVPRVRSLHDPALLVATSGSGLPFSEISASSPRSSRRSRVALES